MKLCPQCAFIYEDNQGFCDMDGQELVHDSASGVVDQTAPPKLSTSLPARSRVRRLSVLFVGAAGIDGASFCDLSRPTSAVTNELCGCYSDSILQQPNANATNPYPSPVDSSNTAD